MKICLYISGAGGFIGSNLISYIKKYCNKVEIKNYDSRKLVNLGIPIPLQNKDNIFIYCAYDRRGILMNIYSLLKSIKFCKSNGISRFIFLSSISIFSNNAKGILNINTPKSNVWEDYIILKKIQESLLIAVKRFNYLMNINIIRVPVILGPGCSWHGTLLNISSYSNVMLPNKGNGICNYLHVDDLSSQILNLILDKNNNKSTYIFPTNKITTWKCIVSLSRKFFYPLHHDIIILDGGVGEYSQSAFKNFLYKLRFSFLGYLLEKTVKICIAFIQTLKPTNPSLKSTFPALKEGIYIPEGNLRAAMCSELRCNTSLNHNDQLEISEILKEMASNSSEI